MNTSALEYNASIECTYDYWKSDSGFISVSTYPAIGLKTSHFQYSVILFCFVFHLQHLPV